MRNAFRSLFRHVHRRRSQLRTGNGWRPGEGDGHRLHRRFGWLYIHWISAHAGRVPIGSRTIAPGRHHAAARSLPDRNPCQSLVADTGCRLPAGRGTCSRRQGARPGNGPERLCVPCKDCLLADGGAARLRDVGASKAPKSRDYRPRLEAFFDAAAVPDAAGAAERLAARYRTISELLNAEQFIVAEDAGSTAASALAAVRELMIQAADDELRKREAQDAGKIASFLKTLIGFRCDECVVVILLDVRHGVIDYEIVSLGRVDSATLDARRILLRAMARGAASIIVAHNHPSGDPTPSMQDIRVTRDLAHVCQSLGISLRDHLVVAGGKLRSARLEGYL